VPWRPKPPVRWFSPSVLAGSAMRVLLSKLFGAWLDKRELQESLGRTVHLHHADATDGLWLDYVADTGDGFDASYTVAWLASQPLLDVAGADRRLPRGALLVLGGDQVYPVASASEYERRFLLPFRAALPSSEEAAAPELWALPGNHDWYDGLTSFLRTFAQHQWVGGRRTCQDRSYFAVQLPHRWWLWAVDTQFDAYVDDPQYRYFEQASALLQEHDRVILCVATPSWIEVPVRPSANRNIAYVERRLIAPRHASVVLSLSGDSHHYARYTGDDGGHRITAGGGGAFLHPTHNLPPAIPVSIAPDDPAVPTVPHRIERCYPTPSQSRRLLAGSIALPLRNPTFAALLGAFHVVLLRSNQFGRRAGGAAGDGELGFADLLLGLVRDPFSLFLVLSLAGALVGFAKPPPAIRAGWLRLAVRALMGLAHAAAQVATVAAVSLLAIDVVDLVTDQESSPLAAVVAFVVGGVAGGAVFGAYLALANLPARGSHGNEAFSAMRRTRYKNFLRLHVRPDGGLTVYAIGVDKVCKRWRFAPEADSTASWLTPEPGAEPQPHVIDRVDVPPRGAAPPPGPAR
jgi:hypothetical protein